MFYVYLLYSVHHDKYYIGQTDDIEQRLVSHNELSEHSFTSKYRPWELKVSIAFPSRSNAIKAEHYLKKKNKAFWQRVIAEVELQAWLQEKYTVG